MRRVRTIAGRFLSALLCAALALSPVAAFAATSAPSEPGMHDAAMSKSTPCDMPCKGCADRNPSLSCLSACMGLIAAIPIFDGAPVPHAFAHRATVAVQNALVGTKREPDTPPPKLVLA